MAHTPTHPIVGEAVPEEAAVVLIVDDNPDHAALLRLVGQRVAPEVDYRSVSDGQEALDYLLGVPPFDDRVAHPFPSLVLLDLMMPRLDGFGVLARLQKPHDAPPVPVVVLTSSLNPVDEARARALGADEFHTKPAGVDAIGDLLRGLVARWMS